MPLGPFAQTIMTSKYARPGEDWNNVAARVTQNVCGVDWLDYFGALQRREFMAGGRYLANAGLEFHAVNNCLLMKAEDSREALGELASNAFVGLTTGAGVGVVYSELRPKGAKLRRTGGHASGPLCFMNMINELGRSARQGGGRRAALWAGLHWWHEDVLEFIHAKDWSQEVRALKARDYNFPAPLDGTNISVILDTGFFLAYKDSGNPKHDLAHKVYREVIHSMCMTGEPGFSVDYAKDAECLRNPCTEVVSEDDSDVCNLGSINLGRVKSLEHLGELTCIGTSFLIHGSKYSDVPYAKVAEMRDRNRRVGLGLMGIHEFLLKNNLPYAPCDLLRSYMQVYRGTSIVAATKEAERLGVATPKGVRAIAPNGTISILAETTSGMEPILFTAAKRRYVEGDTVKYQYILDPTAKRLIDEGGLHPDDVETAYTLAQNPERRVLMQVFLQGYVDQGISSTINLPAWGTELNNPDRLQAFGDMLITHLPFLRGITVYPNGARGWQPITPVDYKTALAKGHETFVETVDMCDISKGEACGS